MYKVPYHYYVFLKVLHIIECVSKESYHMMNFVNNNLNNFFADFSGILFMKENCGKPVTKFFQQNKTLVLPNSLSFSPSDVVPFDLAVLYMVILHNLVNKPKNHTTLIKNILHGLFGIFLF